MIAITNKKTQNTNLESIIIKTVIQLHTKQLQQQHNLSKKKERITVCRHF